MTGPNIKCTERSQHTAWDGNGFTFTPYSELAFREVLPTGLMTVLDTFFFHSGNEHQHVNVSLHPTGKPPLKHSGPAALMTGLKDGVCL